MIIQVSDIPEEGLVLANPGEFGCPFADRSWQLDDVRLRLERDGQDVVVTGRIAATVPLTCSRCLEMFREALILDVDVRYAPRQAGGVAPGAELASDELDVDFYDDDRLDVGAVIDAETTLALPMKPLCRPACQGLCPSCGGNRNVVPCACGGRGPDPRLAVLKDLADRLSR